MSNKLPTRPCVCSLSSRPDSWKCPHIHLHTQQLQRSLFSLSKSYKQILLFSFFSALFHRSKPSKQNLICVNFRLFCACFSECRLSFHFRAYFTRWHFSTEITSMSTHFLLSCMRRRPFFLHIVSRLANVI